MAAAWVGNYYDIPSPFGLPVPSETWRRVLAEWDADAVLWPSQTRPVYRFGRRAKLSRAYSDAVFKQALMTGQGLNPDTRIAYRFGIVLCAFDLPPAIVAASPEVLIAQLRGRDQWQFRTVDKTEAVLAELERTQERARVQPWQDESRVRARAMRTAWRYRTGARISLVGRRAADSSPVTSGPSALTPAPVSPPEV